jgi:hypothetical protein
MARIDNRTRVPQFRFRTLALGVALAATAAVPPAAAQTAGDDWQVTLAPYAWGAAMEGTIAVRGQEAEVEISAEELLEDLDWGAMGMVAARKGDWGVTGDVFYVALSDRPEAPPVEVEQTVGIFTVQGLRRINDHLDLTLGLRWTEVTGSVRLDVPPVEFERTRDWVDPVVGIVLRTFAAGRWHGALIADVGGFGLGSDFAWQLFPSVGVALTDRASLDLGWRTMATDYETGQGSDRFATDVTLSGPVFGFVYQF